MAKTKAKKSTKKATAKEAISKLDNGNIEITYTIPFSRIAEEREHVVEELGKDIEIPGFRKGKAPAEKVFDKIPENTLIEHTLSHILPQLVGETVKKEKIQIAVYPKFELISAVEGKDWQVKATTCELPEVNLGDYKKKIEGMLRASSLWTPEKGKKEAEKEPTREEKEQQVISGIIKEYSFKIPEILIHQEVDARVSRLLERLEKLGISLETYLPSVGKTAQQLREEYEKQAEEAIKLDLILENVAQKENIKVTDEEISQALGITAADKNLSEQIKTPEQKRAVEAVLRKRKALDKLISLA